MIWFSLLVLIPLAAVVVTAARPAGSAGFVDTHHATRRRWPRSS